MRVYKIETRLSHFTVLATSFSGALCIANKLCKEESIERRLRSEIWSIVRGDEIDKPAKQTSVTRKKKRSKKK